MLTLRVRDEADIVASMLEHHAKQGIDAFIITDNGSVDGTRDILESFAKDHVVDLRHDPVHRMQQWSTVTQMARDAYTNYGARWVINADADEFWRPKVSGLTLAEVLAEVPTKLRSFPVDVVNLTGEPAREGTGLSRLVFRDLRSDEQLSLAGLRSQPTHNCVHIGDPDVRVAQGNHWTSLQSRGVPAPELDIEVLHIPWRSWAQYSTKIENMGRGYSENPVVTPSPNHHGMKDYRRLREGSLEPFYILRHPSPDDLKTGIKEGFFVKDDSIQTARLAESPDVGYHPEYLVAMRNVGKAIVGMDARYVELEAERDSYRGQTASYMQQLDSEHNRRMTLERRRPSYQVGRIVRGLLRRFRAAVSKVLGSRSA